MTNYQKFLAILEAGEPSANYGWLDKNYIKVIVAGEGDDSAQEEISMLVITEMSQFIPRQDFETVFEKWCTDSKTYVYSRDADAFHIREALDAAFNGGYKFIILENMS